MCVVHAGACPSFGPASSEGLYNASALAVFEGWVYHLLVKKLLRNASETVETTSNKKD